MPVKNPQSAPDTISFDEAVPGVSGAGPGEPIAPNAPSASDSLRQLFVEPIKGALKGFGSTLRDIGQASSMGTPTADYINRSPNLKARDEATENAITNRLTPTGTGQKAGYWGEKGLEMLAPIGPKGVSTVKDIADPLRAYRSTLIPTEEAAARAATDVIRPGSTKIRGMVNNLMETAPYIQPVTGKGWKTPLEFAKSATKAGQEHSNFFRENFIEPDEMTLGEPYRRVQEINDLLRPKFQTPTMGQQMTNLAPERIAELEAERNKLLDFIYGEASGRTGVPPEEIQAINQRGAKLQSIGDQADAAQAMRRAGYSGTNSQGIPIPFSNAERLMRMVNYLRGGPEAVAGRQLSRIMMAVPREAEALPDVEAIRNYRRMSDAENLGKLSQKLGIEEANKATAGKRMMPPREETIIGRDYAPDREGALNAMGQSTTPRFMRNMERLNETREAIRANDARQEQLLERARETQKNARLYRNANR